MTRFGRLMLPILALIVIAGCASHTYPPLASGPCNNTNYDRKAPIICIDDTDLNNITADPDEAHVYKPGFLHSRTILWWTKSGTGTVSIIWKGTAPTEPATCASGAGQCRANVVRGTTGTFKYYVTVTNADGKSGTSKDPTIIIDTN